MKCICIHSFVCVFLHSFDVFKIRMFSVVLVMRGCSWWTLYATEKPLLPINYHFKPAQLWSCKLTQRLLKEALYFTLHNTIKNTKKNTRIAIICYHHMVTLLLQNFCSNRFGTKPQKTELN